MKFNKIFGKVTNAPYKTVAGVMKKNYIGMSKKYKDDELNAIVIKLNNAIDERNSEEHKKQVLYLKARMLELDIDKKKTNEKYICIFPKCDNEAVHIKLDPDKKIHIVYCDKHYKDYLKINKEFKH